jgi:CubicO group peptidase (beta-lactamase class C family)
MEQGAGPQKIAELDRYLVALVAAGTPPAISVTVRKNGATVYDKAFGIIDGISRAPAHPGDLYHLWSVTKLLTATAIMQLVEGGQIELDADTRRYLPDFSFRDRQGREAMATVRQLLNHTSGMRDLRLFDLIGWINDDPAFSLSQSTLLAERMQSYRRLAGTPGAKAVYSNAGYIVLGAIIEKLSGMNYETCIQQRILQPLRMTASGFDYATLGIARAVFGTHPLLHVFTPLLWLVHRDWFNRWVKAIASRRMWMTLMKTDYTPPTGLIGSTADLARFGQAMLNGGVLDGARILSKESVAAMLDTGYSGARTRLGFRLGLGWQWSDREPHPYKGHAGGGPGFSAQLALVQEAGLVVALAGNDTLMDRTGITRRIVAAFL